MVELAQVRQDNYPKIFEALRLIDLDTDVSPPEDGIYYVPASYAESLDDYEATLSTLNHLAEVCEFSELDLFCTGSDEDQRRILVEKPHLLEAHAFLNDYFNDFS